MDKNSKIYIAGHSGLVGQALVKVLKAQGYANLLYRTHQELDLTNQADVDEFFHVERPDYVFLAAARVGGILANNTYPAEFIFENLAIQTNIIHSSWRTEVKRLLFFGSSCIYPKECPQPMREEHLLSGPLEPTNRPYALAKIAGIEMCWAYNRQYGTKYLAVMPTNSYGPGDNYDLQSSHVLPALIRKMHEAKERGDAEVVAWGTGSPRREFLYSEDMAAAAIFLMNLTGEKFESLFQEERAPLVNIGFGSDLTIAELIQLVKEVVGFPGQIIWDSTKPDGTMKKLLSTDRLNTLGWQPEIDLRQGLRLAYDDFLGTLSSVQNELRG